MANDGSLEDHVFAVGGVIYRRDAQGQVEVLLIKKELGFWTFPKGQVKPGESDIDAVAREMLEETGLSGAVGEAVRSVDYPVFKRGKLRCKHVTYYLMQAESSTLRLSKKERIRKARWFPVRMALKRIKRGRVRKVALRAGEMLGVPVGKKAVVSSQ